MTKFKVSLVALDNHDVPKWVYNEISKNKISFLVNECTTKSKKADILNRLKNLN